MNTKILIVEDQFVEANNLELILKKAGYRICPTARSVQEALKIIGNETPDLVLLDINLPRKSGHEVLRYIKNSENLSQIPVIMLTTSSSEKEGADSRQETYTFICYKL